MQLYRVPGPAGLGEAVPSVRPPGVWGAPEHGGLTRRRLRTATGASVGHQSQVLQLLS